MITDRFLIGICYLTIIFFYGWMHKRRIDFTDAPYALFDKGSQDL